MTDLIERLREYANEPVGARRTAQDGVCDLAADELERLRRANESLQAEVVRRAMERADIKRELAEAQAKIAELRKALAEEMSDEINVQLAEARGLLKHLREEWLDAHYYAPEYRDRFRDVLSRLDAFLTPSSTPEIR